ncbi:MAG TPA: ATP-binding cassette domain-containing protein [Vicinamibacterales bacterium]|jgi:ABC-type lipoprotein export system ATPase subunit
MSEPPALELTRVTKDYKGLRPLRVASLAVARGERVALSGLDRPAAETLIALITGAALPDDGHVRVLGRATTDIKSGDEWLSSLERFGIVSERVALLEGSTLAQNLALSFTMAIDPIPGDDLPKVVALAEEVGLAGSIVDVRAADSPPEARMRVLVGRALPYDPAILLLEHPTASLPPDAVAAFADDVGRVTRRRGLTALAITEDRTFADRAADRHLTVNPATGELSDARKRRWFR